MENTIKQEAEAESLLPAGSKPEDTTSPKNNKVCSVCGDKALGYNFNAVTCESCKAFFRRNALKDKEFKCPFSNSCEVTVVTRRFCQRCRLKKCFDIGMKKEYILSDQEKQQKKQKIQENREKKIQKFAKQHGGPSGQNSPNSLPGASENSPGSPQASSSNSNDGNNSRRQYSARARSLESDLPSNAKIPKIEPGKSQTFHQLLNQASPPPVNYNYLPESASQNHPGAQLNQQHYVPGPPGIPQYQPPSYASSQLPSGSGAAYSGAQQQSDSQAINDWGFDNLDELVAVAIKAEFNMFDLADMPESGDQVASSSTSASGQMANSNGDNSQNVDGAGVENSRPALNEREKSRLEELFVASRSLVEPVELDRELQIPITEPNLIGVINLTDVAIKRIIRMAKKITPFISMCQEDQIALLKGGCTELMILRSVINYNPDRNSWNLPTNKDQPRELRMEVLKEASQLGVNLYEEHQRFIKSFDSRWQKDENVMLLLSAIALFTPERANVIHKDVVKLEQDTYYYLLRRYLETVCTGCEPRRAYLSLIAKLKDLHRLNESHIQVFLEVNPRLVEPLLIEIFDLNPACNQQQY